jgi:hypothetical protein
MKEYEVRLIPADWESHVDAFDVRAQSVGACMTPGGRK